MPEQAIKDKTAIAGIGWTAFTRKSGVRTLTLAAEASLKAIDDAGLNVQDIDGVVSYFHKRPESKEVAEELIRNDPFNVAGVFLTWTVRPWKTVFGNPQLLPPNG